jgi:hypothetical protein
MDVQEYREKLKKKTCNLKEFAAMIGTSYAKALRISHIEGFPLLQIGRDKRVVLSKIDEWLEEHIGECL